MVPKVGTGGYDSGYQLFPRWKQFVPTLETNRFYAGKKPFLRRKRFVPTLIAETLYAKLRKQYNKKQTNDQEINRLNLLQSIYSP